MIEAKDLSPKAKRVALREFASSLNTELESAEEIDAALKLIDILADMPREKALVTLAMARLATMPDTEALMWSQRIISGRCYY